MTVTWLKKLFPEPYNESDPYWVIKAYFNLMYSDDDDFVGTIEALVNKTYAGVEDAYCYFSGTNPEKEEPFNGAKFEWGPAGDEHTIIVSEETCFHYVRLASELYLQKHPEDTEKVKKILFHLPK